ncbi:RNA chaperone Hfq [Romboutsia weinsteinii]|uniref:RNA-binding protein Hfq n=1 Tax=Romboutsia weinsteinii TaxID=2020949 RepID=A0A371J681_9FIRM|nr:RNA chaperone Hfq [Romboutsia weinsteinii]RDY28255.1 RNA chaperone Hfq [Romboutsia weinsteinii]
MKNSVLNLQDLFLNNARKERIPVTIYLMNGVQVKGIVKGFDSYVILVEGDNKQQNMIYKHAVSTILPSKTINLQNNNTQQGTNNNYHASHENNNNYNNRR